MSVDNNNTTDDCQWQLIANGDWLEGQTFPLRKHTVLGRDSECDITIPGTHLSRKHAEIAITGDTLLVRDLESSNGTFVNGKQVRQAELKNGDQIQFDVLTFTIRGPADAASPQSREPDVNSTQLRPVVKVKTATGQQKKSTPADQKKWKHKPTSPGNREQTVQLTAIEQASRTLTVTITAVVVLAVLAGLGYLLTQL